LPRRGETPDSEKTSGNVPKSSNTSEFLPIPGVGGPPAPELVVPSPTPPPNPPEPPPLEPPPDTEAPDISLAISECNQSLSPDGCLIATTTITLDWSSDASDFSYYTIACAVGGTPCSGFSISTTTATTTIYAAPSGTTTYIFTAKSTDTSGNTSAPITKSVEIVTRPVVINEIAWAGTSATRSADEWIELFNTTSKTLDVSQMKLTSLTDNKPNLNLSGNIPASGYYIIERTNDDTISDLLASTTASFGSGSGAGLSNSGEILAITYKGATIDQTPAVSDCGGWCGGAASGSYPTMERYDPYASGIEKENWGTGGDFLTNGKNADGIGIKGTPGKRNTINYWITNGTSLSANKTLTKSQSPYIIPSSGFTIQSGATLTIKPGVILKFYSSNTPSLTIAGKLIAEGTQEENIIFTSLKDDAHAGDTNNDGSVTTPAAEDWGTIKILADGSILKYATMRYGGKRDVPGASMFANIRVENASTSITYSTIEHSGVYGIWLKTASGTIAHNIVQNNIRTIGGQEKGTGIAISGGAPDIRENTITKNIVGIAVEAEGSPSIVKNSFTQNSEDAITISSSYPAFAENTASGNGTNGVVVSGVADKDFMLSGSLPFVTKSGSTYTIPAGKTLTAVPGTIFKMRGAFSVSGKFIAEGTPEKNIVFTSLNDDDYGGDTNGTTTAPAIADWNHIAFNAGSASSSLKYVRIRYGGDNATGADRGAIRITDSSIGIDNAIIEKNYYAGIYMTHSTSTSITNSLIRDHADSTSMIHYGIFLTSSSTPLISNTAFKNNETHIFSDPTSSYTGGENTFE
ncbi:MAG: right-handed parallel beta-helix repeat-containing protein, partial [Candidatus Colwellbacteria bacterium]|nr:right-handed parallel beta-helix repeat-containing protein [Candidatus Colwellbacteria bacterium]